MNASPQLPEEIGGYVLAGGHSSRMGRDKALLELAGKPLIYHAVKKLQRVCRDVRVLSGNPKLEAYAPLVPDLHPGCGPMGGMEAGLWHSVFVWNLFLAVDLPFLPSVLINDWVRQSLQESTERDNGARVQMFQIGEQPQPGFCLLHRDVRPFLTASLERGQYKLMPAFEEAGRELAGRGNFPPCTGIGKIRLADRDAGRTNSPGTNRWATTEAHHFAKHRWFRNLNTPEDFSDAERHIDELDP